MWALCLVERFFAQKDQLGFEEARSYARKAISDAVKILGPQVFLDIGSGTVAAGPFRDEAFRATVSTEGSRWFCLDVAEQHFKVMQTQHRILSVVTLDAWTPKFSTCLMWETFGATHFLCEIASYLAWHKNSTISQRKANAADMSKDVSPMLGDITTVPLPETCTMAVAKDSLNNLSWSALVRTFEVNMRYVVIRVSTLSWLVRSLVRLAA